MNTNTIALLKTEGIPRSQPYDQGFDDGWNRALDAAIAAHTVKTLQDVAPVARVVGQKGNAWVVWTAVDVPPDGSLLYPAHTVAALQARIAELEADRDSWVDQASDRVADAVQFAQERDAALERVKELEAERDAAALLRSAAGADVDSLMEMVDEHGGARWSFGYENGKPGGKPERYQSEAQKHRDAIESALRLLVAQVPKWTRVEDAMPPSGKTVLACYKNSAGNLRRVRACWVAAKTSESSLETEIGEYDEASDTYYDPEGWYEQIDNRDDCTAVFISAPVTHWQDLPPAPKEAARDLNMALHGGEHDKARPSVCLAAEILRAMLDAPEAASQPAAPEGMALVPVDMRLHVDGAPLGFTDSEKSAWSFGVEHGLALALTNDQITAGLKAANTMDSTFDFGDGSTQAEREAACAEAFRGASGAVTPQAAQMNQWQQALDTELVNIHLGTTDTPEFSTPKLALAAIIEWHVQVATDPAVNGGFALVKAPISPCATCGTHDGDTKALCKQAAAPPIDAMAGMTGGADVFFDDLPDQAQPPVSQPLLAPQQGEPEERRYIVVQHPGQVPDRKGPFPGKKFVEDFLREFYTTYPTSIAIVLTMPDTSYPQHGREWLDMYGDQRRKPVSREPAASPPVSQPLPARGMTDVLGDVAKERARQDGKWGGADHDDGHDTADFVQLIEDYAGWARTMAGMNSPHKARNRLVQVAALAVAAVESIDRAAATPGAGSGSAA